MSISAIKAKDFYAGLLFTALGAGAAYKANDYEIGSATQMGPGYFPELLAVILVLLGVGMLVRALLVPLPDEAAEHRSLLPVVLVILGAFGFALTIDRFGLVAAIAALLGCSCLRQLFRRPVEVVLTIGILIAFSVAVFIYGFAMPLSVF